MEDLSYEDQLNLIAVIRDRLDKLETELKQERIQDGNCPHEEMQEITTMKSLKKNRRKFICKDCGERIIYEGGIRVDG